GWTGHSDRQEGDGVRAYVSEAGAHHDGARGPGHPRPHGGGRRGGMWRPAERTMTETALMQSDLDRLTERVERAAQLVQRLREDHDRIARERDELAQRLQDVDRKLQGQDVTALLQELGALRREQKDWHGERREVASRIEAMLKRLEKLEA